jgi:hypothetical protein
MQKSGNVSLDSHGRYEKQPIFVEDSSEEDLAKRKKFSRKDNVINSNAASLSEINRAKVDLRKQF